MKWLAWHTPSNAHTRCNRACDQQRKETETSHENEDKIFRSAPRWAQILNEKLNEVKAGLSSIYNRVGFESLADERRDLKIMSAVTDAIDAIEAGATANDDAADAAEAAFTRLAAMIEDLRNNATDQPTIDRINALATALKERAAALGAAVAATPQ